MEKMFTNGDTWTGGHYELTIEVRPRSDERLFAVLQRIWSWPQIEGSYTSSTIEPRFQEPIPPILVFGPEHLFGVATLPNRRRMACGTCVHRSEQDDADWVDLYVPLGGLGRHYPVGAYPIEVGRRPSRWLEPLNNWFAAAAQHVFSVAPFRFGFIGWELIGPHLIEMLRDSDGPPMQGVGVLVREKDDLRYYPSTMR